MYLISVYFDDKSNKILQRNIDQVAKQTGNTFMIDNIVPPHMTISAIEARNVDVLVPRFEEMSRALTGGEIQIVSPGMLLPYVLYVTPVLNEYLQGLQMTAYDAFKDIEETTISRFYQPYSWLPHVTIGKKLDKEQMKKAVGVMQDSFVPFNAKVEKIGLATVNPHRDVVITELSS